MGGNDSLGKSKKNDVFCEKTSKIQTTHHGEAPKLKLKQAQTLGICIYNFSTLAPAVSAVEVVEISGKVEVSHLF